MLQALKSARGQKLRTRKDQRCQIPFHAIGILSARTQFFVIPILRTNPPIVGLDARWNVHFTQDHESNIFVQELE